MATSLTHSAVARTERARIAALTRSRPADDPELLAARRRLAEATAPERTEAAIRAVVEAAPMLTPEQAQRLRALLNLSAG